MAIKRSPTQTTNMIFPCVFSSAPLIPHHSHIFHVSNLHEIVGIWRFAGAFLTAFAIAKLVEDDSVRFSQHMPAGWNMVFGLQITTSSRR